MNILPIELIHLVCSFLQPLERCKLGLTNTYFYKNLVKGNNDITFRQAVHAIECLSKADDGCPKVTIKCRNKTIAHKVSICPRTYRDARFYNRTHPKDNYYKSVLKLDDLLFPPTPYKTIDIVYNNVSLRTKSTTHKAFNTFYDTLLNKLPGVKKRITKNIVLTTIETK